jgi:hypothetical protein
MYTALDHSSIILAVKWLLKHHLRRRKGIWIPKDATIQPSFSNKPIDPTSGYFFPPRDMILAVVVFDLDNIFDESQSLRSPTALKRVVSSESSEPQLYAP